MPGLDDDGEVVVIGGVAYCRRGEIPEEDLFSRVTRDENGWDAHCAVLGQFGGQVSRMH